MVRLLHTSDIHLAGGFTRPAHGEHRERCDCALFALADLVDRHRPDAVLIPGDLFDHERVSEIHVLEALAALDALGPPVVLIPGNHDVHHANGLYRRHEHHIALSGVTFLGSTTGEVTTLLDGAVTLWAKAMEDHEPGYRPLVGAPDHPNDGSAYVVMGHGHYMPGGEKDKDWLGRSSPILPADIAATGADYVALGHWHMTTDVSVDGVTAWYSGSPLPGNAIGNVLLVDIAEGATAVQRVPVEPPANGCLVAN